MLAARRRGSIPGRSPASNIRKLSSLLVREAVSLDFRELEPARRMATAGSRSPQNRVIPNKQDGYLVSST